MCIYRSQQGTEAQSMTSVLLVPQVSGIESEVAAALTAFAAPTAVNITAQEIGVLSKPNRRRWVPLTTWQGLTLDLHAT